ncbi:MAG TPA: TonB-dependent receptor [Vicinamibacterales bacterium]
MNPRRTRMMMRIVLSTSAIGAALAATGADAQTAPDNAASVAPAVTPAPQTSNSADDEIVITGSRIARRRGDETASPLQTITSQDLDARGYQTVAQALNELPSFGVPGASPVGFNQSSFGAGQSFVDFLGLGSQRTLTLVNGRRFVSGNTSSIFGPTGSGGNQVDLNVIPTKLIDRVETVAAIGAPIYGSDAIAGTINIILKKDYEGLDVDAQSGVSARGDAPDYRLRFLAGKNFAGGRGNITIAGEYDESKGLFFDDRRQTSSDNRFAPSTTGSGPQPIYADNRLPSVSPYGIPLVGGANVGLDLTLTPQQSNLFLGDPTLNFGVNNAAGVQLKFDQNGNLTPINYGKTIGPNDSFSVFTSGGNGFSLRDVENLLTDIKRYSANAELSYNLTDDVHLFGEAWYSVSQGRNLANQPVYNSGLFGAAGSRDGNLIVSINNPFLSPQARATILQEITNNPLSDQNNPFGDPSLVGINQDYFYLGRANVDLSSGVSTGKSEIMRFVGGLDGKVHVLPAGDWHFEAYFNYGRAHVTSRNPELNEQNFLNAINAVSVNGQIVCAPGYTNSPIATLSSTCAPINPFGAQISQAAKDYITTIATPDNVNNQYDGVISIAGPLFKLPGGDFAFALGYEHRAEDSSFNPGAFYFGSGTGDSSQRGSYGRSVPIDPVFGKYHTNEIFGELNADLISDKNNVPFVRELSIQTAGRYIWNSQSGGDPTYTIQGRYAPIKDITFRAAFTRAVRSPSITEAFNPTSSAFGFATDVCDKNLRNSGPAPATRAANCATAGVPAGFSSLSNDRSFQTFTFGNADLKNEKSNNFTAGVVLTPRFIPGFSATVDYVDITLKNAISQFSNSQVVAACYDATNFPNNQFCNLITRDFSGTPASNNNYAQLSDVGTTYFNSAQLNYKGILAEISYRTRSDFLGKGSHIGLDINYQYLDNLSTIVTAGSAPVHTSNSVGYSQNKGVATIRYDNGGFFGQVQVNYIGKARIDPDTALNFYSVPYVNAFTYVNLSLRYDVGKHFSINADVDNVFDAKAPYPYPASGGTTTYFQGILGTYMRIGAAVHF